MGKDRVAYFYDSALPLTYFICRMGKAMALACSGWHLVTAVLYP